jgi:hypothetical protein
VTVHAVLVPEDVATAVPVTHEHDRVAVLDDDAAVSGQALAHAAAVLDQHPRVGIVFIRTDRAETGDTVVSGDRWLRLAADRGPDTVASRCALLRRSVYDRCDVRALGSRGGELSLWLRAAALSDVGVVVEPLPAARLRPSATSTASVGQLTELHERARVFHDLFDGFAPVQGRTRLRAAIFRVIARRARGRALVAAYERDAVEASLCRHMARDVAGWRRLP